MKKYKIFLIVAVILIFSGITLSSNADGSGGWVFQSGLVFLFGAFALISAEKKFKDFDFKIVSFVLMIIVLVLGFFSGMWNLHPLGMIISIVGGIVVFYEIIGKKFLVDKKLGKK